MGKETIIHSSIGDITETTKVKVYYDHPREDHLTKMEQIDIEDGMGALFVEELLRDRLGLDYDYGIDQFNDTVAFESAEESVTLSPGDSFVRANGQTWVFFGVSGNTIHFEDEEFVDADTDKESASISASPNVMAAEYAFSTTTTGFEA